MKAVSRILSFKINHISAMHPAADAKSERNISTMMTILRSLVNDVTEWNKSVALTQIAMNATVHSKVGVSPHLCLFGQHPYTVADILTEQICTNSTARDIPQEVLEGLTASTDIHQHDSGKRVQLGSLMEPSIPTDPKKFEQQLTKEMRTLRENILANKTESQRVYKTYYDNHFKTEQKLYPVGSLVLVSAPPRESKLHKRFEGPFMVLQAIQQDKNAPRVYLLQNIKSGKIRSGLINGDRIKPLPVRQTKNIVTPTVTGNNDTNHTNQAETRAASTLVQDNNPRDKSNGKFAKGRGKVNSNMANDLTNRSNMPAAVTQQPEHIRPKQQKRKLNNNEVSYSNNKAGVTSTQNNTMQQSSIAEKLLGIRGRAPHKEAKVQFQDKSIKWIRLDECPLQLLQEYRAKRHQLGIKRRQRACRNRR